MNVKIEEKCGIASGQSFLLVCDNFLMASILLCLANQNVRTVRGRVVICQEATVALDNSATPSSCILISQFIDVTELSKTLQNLCPSGNSVFLSLRICLSLTLKS